MANVKAEPVIKFFHAINTNEKLVAIKPDPKFRNIIEADIRMADNRAVMAHDCINSQYDSDQEIYNFTQWISDIEKHFGGISYGLKLDFKESAACQICCQILRQRVSIH